VTESRAVVVLGEGGAQERVRVRTRGGGWGGAGERQRARMRLSVRACGKEEGQNYALVRVDQDEMSFWVRVGRRSRSTCGCFQPFLRLLPGTAGPLSDERTPTTVSSALNCT